MTIRRIEARSLSTNRARTGTCRRVHLLVHLDDDNTKEPAGPVFFESDSGKCL